MKAFVLLLAGIGMVGAGSLVPKDSSNQVPNFSFTDITGRTTTLQQAAGTQATVIALTGTTCPLCKKYGPTLASIEDTFKSKGVKFVFVNPSEAESEQDAAKDVARLGFDGPYVHDSAPATVLGARTTTEVFVLNTRREVVYRGAVDDQYGLTYTVAKPRHTYLVDALQAVLAGKQPKVTKTEAPGCVLEVAEETEQPISYFKNVAPVVQNRCVDCHRDGGVAPFSLERYEDVKARAPMLKFAIERGIMPPWFASKETPGPWKNDRSLSDEEKQTLFDWIESGMPKGDPSDAPRPKTYVPGWAIGKPDLIVQIPKPVQVQATGTMPYHVAMAETTLEKDTWVQAMEVKPTDRSVVHHVLVFVKPKGERKLFQDAGEELAGFFAAYVPGNDHIVYPDGFGKMLPAGSRLKFQIHYTPNGKATSDQTQLGLIFAKNPIRHEVQTIGIANLMIKIPAGAPNHRETAQIPVPYDVKLMSFIPHMHVRGKAARYELIGPDGSRQTLLDVPRYDFNWQISYEYAKPVDIKQGSRVEFSAWYDNSDKNPANPNPNRTVGWGSQTYDEMHLGYVEYYVPGLKPGEKANALRPQLGAIIETIFKSLDRNKDGFVTAEEAGRAWDRFKEADADGDGKLSLEEAMRKFGG